MLSFTPAFWPPMRWMFAMDVLSDERMSVLPKSYRAPLQGK
jgi:hypothetical protein